MNAIGNIDTSMVAFSTTSFVHHDNKTASVLSTANRCRTPSAASSCSSLCDADSCIDDFLSWNIYCVTGCCTTAEYDMINSYLLVRSISIIHLSQKLGNTESSNLSTIYTGKTCWIWIQITWKSNWLFLVRGLLFTEQWKFISFWVADDRRNHQHKTREK